MYYCKVKDNCPYLRQKKASEVLAEYDYLKERVLNMEKVMKLAECEILNLREKNHLLEKKIQSLQEELNQTKRLPFKPNIKKEEIPDDTKEAKKKGAPLGHKGGTRKRPTRIDEYIKITHEKCRFCGSGEVTTYETFEEHVVEDIEIKVKNTCFKMHYGYCSSCKRVLYPKDSGIIPNSHIGPQARALGEYLHCIGVPYLKVVKIFGMFGLEITHPTLIGFDKKIAKHGELVYEQIKQMVCQSRFIHADETGWRINGVNHWLWSFTNKELAYYRIEKSRGSDVVEDTLGEKYYGILISDFYCAYNSIEAIAKQKCIGHLLNDIKEVEEKKLVDDESCDRILCQKLKSILKDAIEVWNKFKAKEKTIGELKAFKEIVAETLIEFVMTETENGEIKRLQKRLIRHHQEILTFLDTPEIEPTNNRVERQLRPNVIMRKITFGNRSDIGAKNHSIIMSIIQTAILNNIKPLDALSFLAIKPAVDLSEFISQKIRAP